MALGVELGLAWDFGDRVAIPKASGQAGNKMHQTKLAVSRANM